MIQYYSIDHRFIFFLIIRIGNILLPYLSVHAGTNYLNQTGDIYRVKSVTINKNYNSALLINDIALVHLATSIKYNPVVQPIKLATNDKNLEGKPCTLSGWGTTKVLFDS